MALKQGDIIGILGGGQLAQLLILAATKLGFKTAVFDPNINSPAFGVASHVVCDSFINDFALKKFSKMCDVVTYEFENVPLSAIDIVSAHCTVFPNRKALKIGQNRLLEKNFAREIGINTAQFSKIANEKDVTKFFSNGCSKAVIKTVTSGYDGKGQVVLHSPKVNSKTAQMITSVECIIEEFQEFDLEVSVIAARGESGSIITYDPSSNLHQNGILITTTVPAKIKESTEINIALAAGKILNELDYIGVIGIEFFVLDQNLIFNEFAPRVHNSGHWTLDGCLVSQFEQHIRAITGLPLGSTKRHSNIIMTNIIGTSVKAVGLEGQSVYNYGKSQIRPGRKMGHINKISM